MLLIMEQVTAGPLSSSTGGVLCTGPAGYPYPEAGWLGTCPHSSTEKTKTKMACLHSISSLPYHSVLTPSMQGRGARAHSLTQSCDVSMHPRV